MILANFFGVSAIHPGLLRPFKIDLLIVDHLEYVTEFRGGQVQARA